MFQVHKKYETKVKFNKEFTKINTHSSLKLNRNSPIPLGKKVSCKFVS